MKLSRAITESTLGWVTNSRQCLTSPDFVRLFAVLVGGLLAMTCTPVLAQSSSGDGQVVTLEETFDALNRAVEQREANATTDQSFLTAGPEVWTSNKGLSSSLQVMLLLTVLSMAPAILLMTTSFVRIVVVLGLLRQALGTQQLPPSQVITAMAMFMTLLIMTPVWKDVYDEAIGPYTQPGSEMAPKEAWERGLQPIREFMSLQIHRAGNRDDIWLFYRHYHDQSNPPTSYDEVPIQVLLPAYMLSELKVAFLIGFQIYLPFVILDLVISSVTISMGMLMLPPVMVSLPFKLLLFVLVDGWRLVIDMLLQSFVPYS